METKTECYIELGTANGWTETPEIVKNCKHNRIESGPECNIKVVCDICNYIFWKDCSD